MLAAHRNAISSDHRSRLRHPPLTPSRRKRDTRSGTVPMKWALLIHQHAIRGTMLHRRHVEQELLGLDGRSGVTKNLPLLLTLGVDFETHQSAPQILLVAGPSCSRQPTS